MKIKSQKTFRYLLYGDIKFLKTERWVNCCRLGFPNADSELIEDQQPLSVEDQAGLDKGRRETSAPSWELPPIGTMRASPSWVAMDMQQVWAVCPLHSLKMAGKLFLEERPGLHTKLVLTG